MSYSLLKKVSLRSLGTIDEIRSWYINRNTLIGGRYKRVFQFHIRKTGGRSLSLAFFALSGLSPEAVNKKKDKSILKRVVVNGMVFGARGKSEIENGNYFYASSHLPSHQFSLPPSIFSITVLRNPIDRLTSHYNMLYNYKNKMIHPHGHRGLDSEVKWLGNNFEEFLDNIPCTHLQNQLYMFSSEFNVDEAFEKIINCNHVMFTENLEEGLDVCSKKLDLNLTYKKAYGKAPKKYTLSSIEKEKAEEILQKEFKLIDKIRTLSSN